MFGVFAAVALLLATTGVYSVTAYAVAERTQEIGVRMALGARSCEVISMVLVRGLRLLAIALPVGLAAAVGVGRILQTFLIDTRVSDPITLFAISLLVVVVFIAGCVVPAQRAVRLDPAVTLRRE
jgi:ABC-type antimicrobial peptide transport system permease subunit